MRMSMMVPRLAYYGSGHWLLVSNDFHEEEQDEETPARRGSLGEPAGIICHCAIWMSSSSPGLMHWHS